MCKSRYVGGALAWVSEPNGEVNVTAGASLSLRVVPKDSFGNKRLTGGDELNVTVFDAASGQRANVSVQWEEDAAKDGSYRVRY